MPHILPFKSIYNIRDFGGYAGHDGRQLKDGLLFRSAQLSNISDRELPDFEGLGLKTIIDMRYLAERKKQPSRFPDNFDGQILSYGHKKVVDDEQQYAPHEVFLYKELVSADAARQYMMSSYTERPADAGFIKLCQEGFEAMAQKGDPLLVHCAADKDRTGTFVALIQHLLGMSEEDIFADYMLTEKAVNIDQLVQRSAPYFTQKYNRDYSPEMLRPMFGTHEDYLAASFKTMGDRDIYIEKILGITSEKKAVIAANYLM